MAEQLDATPAEFIESIDKLIAHLESAKAKIEKMNADGEYATNADSVNTAYMYLTQGYDDMADADSFLSTELP